MPAQASPVSRLLVLARAGEAERLRSSLRTSGLEVHTTDSIDPDALAALIRRDGCDLILCCTYDPAIDLDAVLARHRDLADDCPLILVGDRAQDPRPLTWAMERGARDLTDCSDPLHLRLVVEREYKDLTARRALRDLRLRLGQRQSPPPPPGAPQEEAVALIQDGMHADANGAYLRLFGFPGDDDVHAAALLDLIAPEDQAAVRDFLRDRRSGTPRQGADLQVACLHTDGSRFPAALNAAPAEVDGEPGLRLCVRRLDLKDPTPAWIEPQGAARDRLPGYTDLIAAIAAEVGPERRPARPFALFYIAIRTSPTLFGDLGLSRGLGIIDDLAATLARLCGPLGVPARLNVDGYGLLAPGLDATAAADLGDHIRRQVRLSADADGTHTIEAGCEIGYVAVAAGPCAEPVVLLDAAYRACHGSTSVPVKPTTPQKPTSLAARTLQGAMDDDRSLVDQILAAQEQGRLRLVYQPIISLMGENQEYYSVLLRLEDGKGELIEAQSFIGAAIRAGLIQGLDRWVIRNAVAALAQYRRTGQAVNFFINLAEDTFRDRDVQFWIRDCLREFGVHATWLTLVIQEDLFEAGPGGLGPVVERLKTLGCRIAVNYFGATDHSERLLTELSPDLVLLLPDYAKGLAADPGKQKRLGTLATAARASSVKTVVTGVEDAPSLTILWTAGVDYVQGNFLQRPSLNLEISA